MRWRPRLRCTLAWKRMRRAAPTWSMTPPSTTRSPARSKPRPRLQAIPTFVGQLTPACVLPLFRPTEIGVNVVRARTPDGDWGTGAPRESEDESPSGRDGKNSDSRFPVAQLSTCLTGEYAGSFFNVPVTYQFSDSFRLNANFGWIYERDNDRHVAAYGAGVEWIPAKPFTLIAEVFGGLEPETRKRGRTSTRVSRPASASRRSKRWTST